MPNHLIDKPFDSRTHARHPPCLLMIMKQQNNAFQSVQILTEYTKRMALQHDLKKVENCMQLANELYHKGDALVRAAVENIFIYSFSSLMYACNTIEWHMVQSCMPPDLHNLYIRQVLRSRC